MKPFDYAVAENKAGALAALRKGYRPLAGGVDWTDLLKERVDAPERLVALSKVEALKEIHVGHSHIRLGAMATLADLAAHRALATAFPALVHTAAQTASPAIRAQATLGGNLLQRPRCWYYRSADFPCLKKGGSNCYAWAGDNTYHSIFPAGACRIVHPSSLAPVLVAAKAFFVVETKDGETAYTSDDFFLNTDRSAQKETVLSDDALLTMVRIDTLPHRSACVEIKEKQVFDWPVASCAAVWHEEGWRVVLGHVAPLPWRARRAEQALAATHDISPDLAARVADLAVSDAQPMSGNAHRVKLTRAAVRRALLKACGREEDV